MRRYWCLAVLVALTGCSLSPEVSAFTVSYNGSIEDVNNQLLLENILRASNRAPLYFSDLSQIRGALTVNAGTTLTAPFGEGKITTTKHFVGGASTTVSTSPTFDVSPLNEQIFTEGILQPLELQYGKLYWDRADYPEFLLAMLLVDKIEVRYFNDDGSSSALQDPAGQQRPCIPAAGCPLRPPLSEGTLDPRMIETDWNQPEDSDLFANFQRVIANWNVQPNNPRTQRSVIYHGYTSLTPIGSDVALGSQGGLKDFTGLDPHKFRADKVADTPDHYQLKALEDRIIICPPDTFLRSWALFDIRIIAPQISGTGVDVTPQPAAACDSAEWPPESGSMQAQKKKQMQITIYTRSVEGIIQYLGALLRKYPPGTDNPIHFLVHRGHIKDEQVSLDYAGETFSISPYRDDPDDKLGEDNTMPILALVEQLLNLRKSSKEIMTTPAAQVLP